MSERWPQFDIVRDNELIAAGVHFWCKVCLVARPVDDISPDPRYCKRCYECLCQEAELLSPKSHKPDWIPQKITGKQLADVPQHGTQIMHTVNVTKIQSVHNSVPDPQDKSSKRGPKFRDDLPMELISQWLGEGMGAKAISYKLKRDMGIDVHYSTIQRRLQGVE